MKFAEFCKTYMYLTTIRPKWKDKGNKSFSAFRYKGNKFFALVRPSTLFTNKFEIEISTCMPNGHTGYVQMFDPFDNISLAKMRVPVAIAEQFALGVWKRTTILDILKVLSADLVFETKRLFALKRMMLDLKKEFKH